MLNLEYEQKSRIGFTYIMDLISPATPYGRETLRQLRPAIPGQEESLHCELQNVEKTLSAMQNLNQEYSKIEQTLKQVKDIRTSIRQIGEELSEVDLFEIKRFLLQLSEITPLFEKINQVANYHSITIKDAASALELLDPEGTKVATFHISNRHFPALAATRAEKKETERKLRENPTDEEKVELTLRRTNLVAQEQDEEFTALKILSKKLKPWRKLLLETTDAIGRLDLVMQKAKLAAAYNTCMPKVEGATICFKEMTNPYVASMLTQHGSAFTPLSFELHKGTTVITGANMGGKSVALKTLALNILLIHCGFYPFASEARCSLLSTMHLVSDDLEATDRGLSSFGGEIVQLGKILREIDKGNALILLDEFARGTNPTEGGAIARGVCEYMNIQDAYTVMATHYEGVAALANTHYQVVGLSKINQDTELTNELANVPINERVAVIANYMDYGLIRVSAEKTLPMDAINICKMLGLEEEIIDMIDSNISEN